MLWLMTLLGCSGDVMDFTGGVGGSNFTPLTGFFGGEYIIFFDEPIDCKEMYWVTKIYRNGDAPYDETVKAFQVTYNDSEVVAGTYSVGGEAPITAQFLDIAGDSFSTTKATEGSIIVNDVVAESSVDGTFAFAFGEDTMEGTFNVSWCINLVH